MYAGRILVVISLICVCFECHNCDGNFFLKAAKNIPRIGRSNNKSDDNEEMGKFFMKASKSVPRIGRRNDDVADVNAIRNNLDKRNPLFWSNLAEQFEYEPELFAAPEFLERLENFDENPTNNWEKMRLRRSTQSDNQLKFMHKI